MACFSNYSPYLYDCLIKVCCHYVEKCLEFYETLKCNCSKVKKNLSSPKGHYSVVQHVFPELFISVTKLVM